MVRNDDLTIYYNVQRIHLTVHGVVQGVGFRRFALREAKRFGVTGWVRNLPDHTVEIEAQGDNDSINLFIGWANRGAPTGRVDRVEQQEIALSHDEKEFLIIT